MSFCCSNVDGHLSQLRVDVRHKLRGSLEDALDALDVVLVRSVMENEQFSLSLLFFELTDALFFLEPLLFFLTAALFFLEASLFFQTLCFLAESLFLQRNEMR